MRYRFVHAASVVFALTMVNCASGGGGGDQLENTVYATHRMVQNLDRNLGDSVARLNETSAELLSRVQSSDTQSRQLLSMVEENQRKIDQLQRRLDELTTTLYRQMNLSPPSDISATPQTTPPVDSGFRTQTVEPGGTTPPAEELITAGPPTVRAGGVMPAPQTSTEDPESFYLRGRDLYANEDFAAALTEFDRYLALYPNAVNAGNAQYWKAHCYFKLNQFEQAIDGFQILEERFPDNQYVPIAMHNEAVAFSRLGQNDRAIATFERLIELYPNDVTADMARDKLEQLRQVSP